MKGHMQVFGGGMVKVKGRCPPFLLISCYGNMAHIAI